ncbi:MAG: ABC-F family ATP-binding cassette domain-containing protein [Bacteroidetes bacterium]|nr:MAG: ABC-F family ATP-binding cassette domain-containing protein [Bacteroidota bacterium]
MLVVSNLSIHFANRYLFDGVTFSVNAGERIGLIGRNGSGKTTLLNIISGKQRAEEGDIIKPKEYRIGYLPQEADISSNKIVRDEVYTALDSIQKIETRLEEITNELKYRTDFDSEFYKSVIQEQSELHERFAILGGHSIEAEIGKVMKGLGFDEEDLLRKVNELSGGWQMRIELAKILLSMPDMILLDEPTNHLDIDSVIWVENFLRNYKGSVLLVSHDRTFLDSVTNRTIEISNGKIYDLNKSYTEFIKFMEEQREHQINAYKDQQKHIAETEKYIERFRYKATLATRVQSKIKMLEKIERIDVEETDIASIRFKFPGAPNSGRMVAEVINLDKIYGDKKVLSNINFSIEKGDKIAFIGRNGEGKTTFSKILAGVESYLGEKRIGHNISVGFYEQQQANALSGDDTVFDTIDRAATGEIRTKLRQLLGAFLFRGEDIYKKVKVLSGGEKSRLAIAKLLLQPCNFLIMDEPTNHLDMVSKDVLKMALIDYKGTLIIVSHDREFLHGLTNKTVMFKNHQLIEYPGDLYEFLEKQKIESLRDVEQRDNNINNNFKNEQITGSQIYREEKKKFQREENKLKKRIEKCESEIAEIEEKISIIEKEFTESDFYLDIRQSKRKQKEFEDLKNELELKIGEWEKLHSGLEEFQSNYL